MKELQYSEIPSPQGKLSVAFFENKLAYLNWGGKSALKKWADSISYSLSEAPAPAEFLQELHQYFEGKITQFKTPIVFLKGTPFQKTVWKNLLKIPYGQTRSYRWLAEKSARPKAFRAAGSANGKNAIPIVIPCHRVINSNKALGGYSSGLERKKALLKLEGISL